MNLLIPYRYIYGHIDPLFEEFTYGEARGRAKQFKKHLKKGNYVFFHTGIGGKKIITAYYIVDRVLDTAEAIKDKNIVAKYKNPHILEFPLFSTDEEDVVLFGDPITSKVLERPLPFDKTLAEKLSLNIEFPKEKTETQAIGSATRAHRELTDKDVKVLLREIKKKEKIKTKIIRSTAEVTESIEKDIEKIIEKTPRLIGDVKLKGRQLDTPVGRIDLLLEAKNGNPIVVELKRHKIGRDAIKQLRRYMDWAKKETKKEVSGAIICEGVMPAFEEDFKKLKDIKIFCYGWQLKVYPWDETK